jgi:hypothetical protein
MIRRWIPFSMVGWVFAVLLFAAWIGLNTRYSSRV